MKNILIPTVLEEDTVAAVKTAVKYATAKNSIITLMILQKLPDSFSAAAILRETKPSYTTAQDDILEQCLQIAAASGNCRLVVHNQCGISAPLLKNLMEYLGTDLILFTPSYKEDKNTLNSYCAQLLLNSKCPILHLGGNENDNDFNKALFLEREQTKLDITQLQQIVNGQFSFRIVSQAKVPDEQNPADITPLLSETILKNNIDLLIETRKSEKRKKKKSEKTLNESLGLPVLSIYEEAL
jgi:hypothetical protein